MRKTKKRGRIASSNHNWSDAPLYFTFYGFSLFLLTLEHFRPDEPRIGINKVEKEPKRAWKGTKKDRPTPPFTDKIAKQYLKASHIVVLFLLRSFMFFPVNFHLFLSWYIFVHIFWSFSLLRDIYLILLHFFLIPYFLLIFCFCLIFLVAVDQPEGAKLLFCQSRHIQRRIKSISLCATKVMSGLICMYVNII